MSFRECDSDSTSLRVDVFISAVLYYWYLSPLPILALVGLTAGCFKVGLFLPGFAFALAAALLLLLFLTGTGTGYLGRRSLDVLHEDCLKRILFLRQQDLMPNAMVEQSRPPKTFGELFRLCRDIEALLPGARRALLARQAARIRNRQLGDCTPPNSLLEQDTLASSGDGLILCPPWALAAVRVGLTLFIVLMLALGWWNRDTLAASEHIWGPVIMIVFPIIFSCFVLAFLNEHKPENAYRQLLTRIQFLAQKGRGDIFIPPAHSSYRELYPTVRLVRKALNEYHNQQHDQQRETKLRAKWQSATGVADTAAESSQ